MLRWETQPYTYKKNNHQLVATIILLCIISIFYVLMQHPSAGQVTIFADEYTEYVVQPGDTLWSIAREYRGRRDIRDVVWELREVNGITPMIHPGQVLWVPVK
jgi:nucleoid-associated protein YgaU